VSLAGAVVWQGAYWYCRATKVAPNWLMELWLFAVFEFLFGMALTVPAFPAQAGALALTVASVVVDTRLMVLHVVCATAIFWVSVYNNAYSVIATRSSGLATVPQPHMAESTEHLLLGIIGYFIAAFIALVVFGIAREFRRISGEQEDLMRQNTRDTTNAPTEGRIAILFTDIQDSTKLWGNAPLSMGAALDAHHEIIRKFIDKYKAFEVKTAGDSFMVAVGDEKSAMNLAIDIQLELMKVPFPRAIEQVYNARTNDDLEALDDDPDDLSYPQPGSVWNGPRVRIGIHCGTPGVVFDDVTKGYDYYGPEVNVAARVEAVAKGGQICCTRAFVEVQPLNASGYTTMSLGLHDLKGVPEATEIFQVTADSLSLRKTTYDAPLEEGPTAILRSDSSHSLTSTIMEEAEYGPFVHSMFAAFRKDADREMAIGLILRAWRLQRQECVDRTYEAIARRVGGTVSSAKNKSSQAKSTSQSASLSPSSGILTAARLRSRRESLTQQATAAAAGLLLRRGSGTGFLFAQPPGESPPQSQLGTAYVIHGLGSPQSYSGGSPQSVTHIGSPSVLSDR
jgi:class 3 adenylate cyclase